MIKPLKKWLLAEPKLTYKRAIELAQELESTDWDMKLFHGKETVRSIPVSFSTVAENIKNISRNIILSSSTTTGNIPKCTVQCFRCGAAEHIATKMRYCL